jgi:hypothetical protein
MPTNDWYPTRIADRTAWHANFSAQAALSGTAHGLVAAQVTQIGVDAGMVSAVVKLVESAADYAQAVTQWKEIVLSGTPGTAMPSAPTAPDAGALPVGALPAIEARTRQYVSLIKASVGYNQGVGELYGIVAAVPVPLGTHTPSLAAEALTGGRVSLKVTKAGYDVIAIDGRRGGSAWEQIGVSMTTEYIDTRPLAVTGQPEQREYRAQGMVKNDRVGNLSDVVVAVAAP